MKRFLLAALLALILHGLFLGFFPGPVETRPPKKPHIITISLASYRPVKSKPAAKPAPAVKPARIIKRNASRKPPEKKPDVVIKPLSERKAIEVPTEILEPKKEIEAHPEKSVRPQKKAKPLKRVTKPRKRAKKPLKRITKPQKKPPKPKAKPKSPARTVTAALIPEKKKIPKTPPRPDHASIPPKTDQVTPIEETVTPEEYQTPVPDIPEESVIETETKIASIPPAKVVREARPDYKDNPRPQYPKRARRRGYEGTVILDVLVDGNGGVKELRILTSSGHSVLDKAALRSVKGWLFKPGMVGDEKMDMWVRVPVRFELRGG